MSKYSDIHVAKKCIADARRRMRPVRDDLDLAEEDLRVLSAGSEADAVDNIRTAAATLRDAIDDLNKALEVLVP